MKTEISFGIIPLRINHSLWEVFLIQHRNGDHWGFPKGKPHLSENPKQTALRELEEETSLHCVSFLIETPLKEQYTFNRDGELIHKRVLYYLAKVEGSYHLQGDEVLDGKWCAIDAAAELITFVESRNILERAKKNLY